MAAWQFGRGIEVAVALSSLYAGYGPSFIGAIIAAVWGFVDRLILGAVVAGLDNRFLLSRCKALPQHEEA